jgi:hypothetical protein
MAISTMATVTAKEQARDTQVSRAFIVLFPLGGCYIAACSKLSAQAKTSDYADIDS